MKVGDRVTRKNDITGRDIKQDGTVIYIHPERRFYIVQYDNGIKDTFYFTVAPDDIQKKMKR